MQLKLLLFKSQLCMKKSRVISYLLFLIIFLKEHVRVVTMGGVENGCDGAIWFLLSPPSVGMMEEAELWHVTKQLLVERLKDTL